MVISQAFIGAIAGSGVAVEDFEALIGYVVPSDTSSYTLTSAGSAKAWTEYQDLFLISQVRETTGGNQGGVQAQLNAASSTYRIQYEWSEGTVGSHTAAALRENNTGARMGWCTRDGAHADEYGAAITTFADINSGRWKTVVNMGGAEVNGAGGINVITSMWENTAAVTSIVISPSSGANLMAGSRFDLYGIRAA